MTDLRALIHRMADELDHYRQLLTDNRRELHSLATEARAELAKPEPEELTDEEIMELMPRQMHEDLAAAARAMAEQAGTDSTRVKGVMRIILNRHIVDLARAVLARWGNRSAPQPVPVSEPPRPEDCDAEGRCWWWYPPALETYGCWVYEDDATDRAYEEWPSAWLPVNALPLPEEVV